MTLSLFITPAARLDVKRLAEYLEERNTTAARRFVQAVAKSAEMLLHDPELVERLRSDPSGRIRYRTVLEFRNHLIFYRRTDSALEILRLLHGATDDDAWEMTQ